MSSKTNADAIIIKLTTATTDLTHERDRLQETLAIREKEILDVRAKLEEAQTRERQTKETHENAVRSMTFSAENHLTQLDQTRSTHADLQQAHQKTAAMLARAQSENEVLTKSLRERDQELAMTKTSLELARQQVDESKRATHSFDGEAENVRKENNALKDDVAALKIKIDDINAELARSHSQVRALNERIAKMTTEHDADIKGLEEMLKSEHEAELLRAQTSSTTRGHEIVELRNKLDSTIEDYEAKIRTLRHQLTAEKQNSDDMVENMKQNVDARIRDINERHRKELEEKDAQLAALDRRYRHEQMELATQLQDSTTHTTQIVRREHVVVHETESG
jgi:chromosome segregation ATPase